MASGNSVLLFDRVTPPGADRATSDVIAGGSQISESIHVWDFDDSARELMDFHGFLSNDYAGGGVTVVIPWSASTATSGDVVWRVTFRRIEADVTDLDTGSGLTSFETVTDAAPSAVGEVVYAEIAVGDASSALDGLSAGERFIMRVGRDGPNASDTMTGDAELHFPYGRET